jgi:hypothetical protein
MVKLQLPSTPQQAPTCVEQRRGSSLVIVLPQFGNGISRSAALMECVPDSTPNVHQNVRAGTGSGMAAERSTRSDVREPQERTISGAAPVGHEPTA